MPGRMKAPALQVPANQIEAEQLLGDIGKLQRQVAGIELRMNERLAGIKASYEQEAQPLNAEIDEKFRALHAWAEAHRDELLAGRGKTVKLATGELSWRISPPSVRVTKPEAVIEALGRLGLERFVRTKKEIDKQAVLAEPGAVAGVKGISVTHPEEFVAKPFESAIEKVETVKATDLKRRA